MRTVPIKTPEQQAVLCQDRVRELLIGQRTQLSNIICGLVGDFGYTLRKRLSYICAFAEELKDGRGPDLPDLVADVIASLCEQLLTLHRRILALEKKIFQAAPRDRRVKLLETIPGIGPVSAPAIIATVGTPDNFKKRPRLRGLDRSQTALQIKRWTRADRQDYPYRRSISQEASRHRYDLTRQSRQGAAPDGGRARSHH